jgi:hypothetical protein
MRAQNVSDRQTDAGTRVRAGPTLGSARGSGAGRKLGPCACWAIGSGKKTEQAEQGKAGRSGQPPGPAARWEAGLAKGRPKTEEECVSFFFLKFLKQLFKGVFEFSFEFESTH